MTQDQDLHGYARNDGQGQRVKALAASQDHGDGDDDDIIEEAGHL